MTAECAYESAGWSCDQGQLRPNGVTQAAPSQPCPQCATTEFLERAWQRAQRVNASCACFSCMPRLGLGTAGFKMAWDEAMRLNPGLALAWRELQPEVCQLVN